MNGIKGAERRTVVVRTSDSKIFDTAFFILRCDGGERVSQGDMVAEAARIIENVSGDIKSEHKSLRIRLKSALTVLISAAVGACITAVVILVSL